MPSIEVFGIEHLELTVNDLQRSIPFYEKVLGALGFRRLPGDGYIGWSNALMTVALHAAAEQGAAFNRYRVGLHHVAFKAKSRADVDAFYRFLVGERLTILDAPAEYPQYGAGYYAIFFADPDGMKLEVAHFPWGYWQRAQQHGRDERPRHLPRE